MASIYVVPICVQYVHKLLLYSIESQLLLATLIFITQYVQADDVSYTLLGPKHPPALQVMLY